MVAIFAAIFDQPAPRFTRFNGLPKVFKSRWRHIRVTYQVMRRTYQLCVLKAANIDKRWVSIGDAPLGIGTRD